MTNSSCHFLAFLVVIPIQGEFWSRSFLFLKPDIDPTQNPFRRDPNGFLFFRNPFLHRFPNTYQRPFLNVTELLTQVQYQYHRLICHAIDTRQLINFGTFEFRNLPILMRRAIDKLL